MPTQAIQHVRWLLASLLILFALSSCHGSDGETPSIRPVHISIYNASTYELEDLEVSAESYDTLHAQCLAASREYEGAYRFTRVSAAVEGEILVLQPISYVGETRLSPGRYTYVIDIEESADGLRRLTIELVADMTETSCDPNAIPVEVTVHNLSEFDLVDLLIWEESYGTLAATTQAEPRIHPFAYRTALVTATVEGDELRIQPGDLSDQHPLGPGRVTYLIDVESDATGSRKLTLEVIDH